MENPSPESLRQAMTESLQRLTVATGEIAIPAVPAMLDDYVTMCDTLFSSLGARFSTEDVAQLRAILANQLSAAYAASPRSKIVISYRVPVGFKADYHVKARWYTVQEAYDKWVTTPCSTSELGRAATAGVGPAVLRDDLQRGGARRRSSRPAAGVGGQRSGL